MADDDLEQYELKQGYESIESTSGNEGTNASRFAIAGAITAPASLENGLTEIETNNLERFGFNPNLISRNILDSVESFESLAEEAGVFLDQRRSWSSGEARPQAWYGLASQGDLRARLMFLAAGVSSELERESTAAAVALIGLLRGHVSLEPLRRSPGSHLLHWWTRPWIAEWLWTWDDQSDAPPSESDDSMQRSSAWNGTQWRAFAEGFIADVLEADDESILLAALLWIAALKVQMAMRSGDGVVREFALAARLSRGDDPPTSLTYVPTLPESPPLTSTIIHGTWGWKGDWWYPGGDFYSYVQQKYRPHLYGEGMEFSWSGAYSKKQRATAAERFSRWVDRQSPVAGLETVFAHSYGGEVAARAINSGVPIRELVLLSAPINAHHRAALFGVSRVVDVRLRWDIVIALARERQEFPRNFSKVTECIIDKPYWKHGATRTPEFWKKEQVAFRVGL